MGRKQDLPPAVGLPGRPKKYSSEAALERAIQTYWRSISRTMTVKEWRETGEVDDMGHAKKVEEIVYSDAGTTVQRREWLIPPSITGLCTALGISRQTWANYAADEKLLPAVERARQVVQEYLEGELLTRQKNLQGVVFALQNNAYRWTARAEVEAGPRTGAALAAAAPLGEKLELLRELYEQGVSETEKGPVGAGAFAGPQEQRVAEGSNPGTAHGPSPTEETGDGEDGLIRQGSALPPSPEGKASEEEFENGDE